MSASTVFDAAPSLPSDPIPAEIAPADAGIAIDIGGIRNLLAGPGLALDLDLISAPKGTACPLGWNRVVFPDHDLFLRVAAVVRSPATHRGI